MYVEPMSPPSKRSPGRPTEIEGGSTGVSARIPVDHYRYVLHLASKRKTADKPSIVVRELIAKAIEADPGYKAFIEENPAEDEEPPPERTAQSSRSRTPRKR